MRPSESVIMQETISFRKPRANIPESGLSAQAFTASIDDLVGRPFKAKKHLAPETTQQHLGLVNHFTRFENGQLCLRLKEGKMEEIYNQLLAIRMRMPRVTTLAEMMHITGVLIFFLLSCFDKIGRGGLRSFYDWIALHCDSATLWKTKQDEVPITASLMVGVEFFLRSSAHHS